jgi:hypothetical protein
LYAKLKLWKREVYSFAKKKKEMSGSVVSKVSLLEMLSERVIKKELLFSVNYSQSVSQILKHVINSSLVCKA